VREREGEGEREREREREREEHLARGGGARGASDWLKARQSPKPGVSNTPTGTTI